MSKQTWQEHWKAVGTHDAKNCPQCQARKKTRQASEARRERDQVYKDCGLTKVRGNLGGTYWE